MNREHVRAIWQKEMLETLRDKRTLYMMVLLPLVIMPLLVLAGPIMMERQLRQSAEIPVRVLWLGSEAPENLAAMFVAVDGMVWMPEPGLTETEARERLANGEVDVAVLSAASSSYSFEEGTLELEILFDASRSSSTQAVNRVEALLQAWSEQITAERLAARGLPASIVEPVRIVAFHDITPDPEGFLGGMLLAALLPLFAALGAVAGGMYTALDAGAGEKERNSLESLMMAPVSRTSLVLGKFAAIWTVTFAAVALMILSMTVSVIYVLPRFMSEAELALRITLFDALALFVLMGLFVALTSAVELSMSVYARSFREGQAYMTVLTFAVMLPGMYVSFGSLETSHALWAYAVPVLNVLLVFQETLTATGSALHWIVALASLAVSAAVALAVTIYCFKRENVVFRA